MNQKVSGHMLDIQSIAQWFREAKPIVKNNDIGVQMGVHFEEVGEMLQELSAVGSGADHLIYKATLAIKALANDMKNFPGNYYVREEKRVKLLDALCDQIVTATGTGVFLGMDIEGAIKHVDDSNWSKFVDGKAIFNEQGKIAKGPGYFKPDLYKFI